ncbi:hypothetical protein LOK49_LG04G01297 [Camellia lanceoleosa]|uniref:Uncharacterized protein n=1 Tax=Camellia lanceoleosa TaxID=1840588 RepID=A0ACC0I5H4_9ERIC|nr:hypothetical protein LOK49_LG04G01297 [Camellia lanceoleosa]
MALVAGVASSCTSVGVHACFPVAAAPEYTRSIRSNLQVLSKYEEVVQFRVWVRESIAKIPNGRWLAAYLMVQIRRRRVRGASIRWLTRRGTAGSSLLRRTLQCIASQRRMEDKKKVKEATER